MRVVLLLTPLVILLGLLWGVLQGPLRDPSEVMADFLESRGRGEDQLTDPLVLAGPRVLPLLLSAVANREMKLRRYALFHLGCAGYRPAADLLARIVSDDTEIAYCRADALEALWRIDQAKATELAYTYRLQADDLGQQAALLVAGGPLPKCRCWFDALRGTHD